MYDCSAHGSRWAMWFRATLLVASVLWLTVGRAHAQGADVQLPGGLSDLLGPTTQPQGNASAAGGSGSSSDPAVQLSGGKSLPLNSPEAEPPPPPPLPNLPPGAGMGGFPGLPEPEENPSSFQRFIRDNLTVNIRGTGTLRLYGFLRADLDYATNRFNDIQNPFFVLPHDAAFRVGSNNVSLGSGDNPNYSLYPRMTRLGAEYYGKPIPLLDNAVGSGRIEIDFMTLDPGGIVPNSESRQLLRIRLAYAQVQHDGFTFLVGQDWDLISPLLPTINDNTLMWNAGNLGDRRPQMKFLYNYEITPGTLLQIQNGLWLADAVNSQDLDGNGLRDAEDRVVPGYQGRLGLVAYSWVPREKILTGVWGALGQSHTATPIGRSGRTRFHTSVIGYDLRLPIIPGLTFQGECWTGKDLDDLRGGAGQGINTTLGREIAATGGWFEFVTRPVRWYQMGVGVTSDNPVNSDVQGIVVAPNQNAGRTNNWAWYVSNRFPVGQGLVFGADYLNWTTDWVGYNRGHASLFKFFTQLNF